MDLLFGVFWFFLQKFETEVEMQGITPWEIQC